MSRDIRRKLEEGRGEAARVMDLLRQSFALHADEQRAARERIKQRHVERARNYWQEAANNDEQKGA
ncbi:MAG TPA: hypothetical protein VNA27_12485 [Rubrobacteraceae bacterium]|nr:hypothetical protein [Rubrobacteraceae bacterium]